MRVAAGVVVLAFLAAIPAVGKPASLPANCDPARPAVAFHPGAAAPITPQPANRPIPCGSLTGSAAGESRIAASNEGVVFSPAGASVAYSTDQGVSWRTSGSNGGIDDNLYADKQGRARNFWGT